MTRLAIMTVLSLCFAALVPAASAQQPVSAEAQKNHGNLGAYLDYTRLSTSGGSGNMLGFGGRVGFNVQRHIVLEAEMAYDLSRSLTSTISAGSLSSTTSKDVKLLHGLFGFKIQTTGSTRMFALMKGGFVNFGVSGPAGAGAINNQIGDIVNGNTAAALYPGGGVEFSLGKVGIRAEAGDEIMFLSNKQNNFRATIGPNFRF